NHTDELFAAHLRLELASNPAIGARRYGGMFRLANVNDRLLDESRGRAGLNASAAGHAFRLKERLHLPRRHPAAKPPPVDRESKSSLHLLAGADAAVANDAFCRIIAEIRVRFVLLVGEVVGARIAIANIAQAHIARLGLQLAISVGGAGKAIERM